jgi:hypothetical protein
MKIFNDFTIEDIRDKELLKRLVDEESNQIFRNSSRGRSFEEVRSSVQQSKVAELYLVESGEYSFSDIKYHDLVNERNEIVEIKAYSSTEVLPTFVIKDIRKIQSSDWNKSQWYYYSGYHRGIYTLHQRIKVKTIE